MTKRDEAVDRLWRACSILIARADKVSNLHGASFASGTPLLSMQKEWVELRQAITDAEVAIAHMPGSTAE